jgi:superfamily II DNA or RNA helicase
MLFDHLNLAYLGKYGKGFDQIQSIASKRGDLTWTDQHLLAKCFEANADRSLFQNKTDLIEFIFALDLGTQTKLNEVLGRSPEECEVLELQIGLEKLGLPEEFLRSVASAPTEIAEKYYAPVPKNPTLYGYQQDVFERALNFLEPPHGRCMVQMPTGAGKTRTALEVVFSFLNQGKSVLWLANTEELIDQCLYSFDELWPNRCHQASWVINHTSNPTRSNGERQVAFHLATIQSIARHDDGKVSAFESYGHEISLVVIDEAHISIAPRYKNALEAFCLHHGRRLLGLSATPGRGAEREEENAELAEFFHENLVKLNPPAPYENALSFLQDEGVLARPKYLPLEIDWAEDLLAQFSEEYGESQSEQVLNEWLGKNLSRNSLIVESLVKSCREGKQIIYFGTSVEQGEIVATMLRLLGITSASISAQTKGRKALIADFKSKRLQVLCNYGVLTTGFDAPQTDVVFIARTTSSVILYHQMIGRGLRGPKFGGSATCEIVTVLDNIEGLVTSDQILNYFDGYFEVVV